jgi:hypothetical protein
MKDETAQQMVFVLLLIVTAGIIVAVTMILGPILLAQVKNNSGHYSTSNILMITAVLVGAYILFVFMTTPTEVQTSPRLGKERKVS